MFGCVSRVVKVKEGGVQTILGGVKVISSLCKYMILINSAKKSINDLTSATLEDTS